MKFKCKVLFNANHTFANIKKNFESENTRHFVKVVKIGDCDKLRVSFT
jgi:hypothetical protein